MITKDQIIKALYNSAKKTETTEGVEMNFIFADQADAILNLLQADVINSYNVEKFKRMEVAIKIILTNIELLGTRQNKEYTISKQDINTLKDALK